uniref:TBC1 domain family, member 10C n=1 Tax=Seriola dumerili TaxID=41447 RepID=A0A3B4UPR4_SERDU
MLSPSSPAQKNLSEEDSSGSDAGSEVGLEPETDRFGFILTNGSTAGSVGPPPELVRQRETKWINIILQWDRMLLKKTSKVKVQCQKGIPASLRAKCWPLLCAATERMKQNEHLYESLDSQPALQSWVDVIERDLDRQFPFHEMFLSKDGHGQRGLFRVLKAYTQYQPEEGYCQAQGPVAAVLLMNMPAEEAFWCLVQISEQYLPGYYSPLLEGVLFDAGMLTWVLKRTCPAAHKHLQHHGVEPLMFATDWLMCLFTRHLPFNTLLRVWDLFFCYGVRVLLQVAVVLVRRVLGRAELRKQCPGQMETLERLRGVRDQVQEDDDAFIAEVCSIPLSARDLERHTEKELHKWRKERPSSTFDPRGRCLGYRMAWARARLNEEERDRKERQRGNLSVPLSRSASTLSLSPSLLHKRLRKGGKANTGEWEGGGKVVRHLSMGAKEDWRNWNEFNFKKVQGVQEEEDDEEHKKQSESKLTMKTEEKELLEEPKKMDKVQNTPTEHSEETETVKEQTEEVETKFTEKEANQPKETEDNKIISEQTEETNEEAHQPKETEDNKIISEQTEETNEEAHQPKETEDNKIISEQTEETNEEAHQPKETEDNKIISEQTEETNEEAHQPKETEDNKIVSEQTEETNEEAHQPKETEDNKIVSEQTEETIEETEPSQSPTKDKTAENLLQPTERGEELDSYSQSQVLEQQNHKGQHQETEVKDTKEEAEEQVSESKYSAAVEENQNEIQKGADADPRTDEEIQASVDSSEEQMIQAEMKPEERTESKHEPKTQVDVVTEVSEVSETRPETSSDSETNSNIEAATFTDPDLTIETGTQEEVITETDKNSQGDALSMASLAEADIEECHTQTETKTEGKVEENAAEQNVLEIEKAEIDSEQHIDSKTETKTETETLILSSPECIQQEDTDVVADTEDDAEMPVADDTVKESSEECAHCSEEECDTVASEPAQEKEEIILTVHSEAQVDNGQTQAEETPAETQTNVEAPDSVAPPENEETPKQAVAVTLTTEPDGKTSSSEEPAPEEPRSHVTVGPSEEEGSTENVQENTVGEDDVFISTPNVTDNPRTDSNPHVENTDDSPAESNNSSLTQASGHRSNRTSGDFCVRKSSSSRGSRLTRRLSEDLFTIPQKTSQSQPVPNHPEVTHDESPTNPGAVNQTQTPPDVTQSSKDSLLPTSEVTEGTVEEQEPSSPSKRFGLFRRLRGEQPKKAKKKAEKKMQVPKILIQDFSDETTTGKLVEEEGEEKLSSRERRRRRREQERREKEEERLRKKKEKEMEKERERERKKPQTRGKSFQVQKEKADPPQSAKTGSQTLSSSTSYAESYF